MVSLTAVRETNTDLVKRQSLVAVVVGGTSGIGEFSVRSLAETHGSQGEGLRIYIVGRNHASAERIIATCRQLCPQGQFIFIAAKDLSLLRDVDRVCEELMAREYEEAAKRDQVARIDFLVTTQGVLNLSRKETAEGIDETMSLFYYSRMRFAYQLLPLLLQSELPAHVVSVLAPGHEAVFHSDDISLRKSENFTMRTGSSHFGYMTTFFMEQLASRHPGKLSLIHVYPGAVITKFGQTDSVPIWVRLLCRFVLVPLMYLWSLSEDECGQRVMFLASKKYPAQPAEQGGNQDTESHLNIATATNNVVGGGSYRITKDGETLPTPDSFHTLREQGVSELIWKHTMEAFEVIARGALFTG